MCLFAALSMWKLPIVLKVSLPSLSPLYFDNTGHDKRYLSTVFFITYRNTQLDCLILNLEALFACDQSEQTDRKEGDIAELSSWVCINVVIFLIHNAFVHIFSYMDMV